MILKWWWKWSCKVSNGIVNGNTDFILYYEWNNSIEKLKCNLFDSGILILTSILKWISNIAKKLLSKKNFWANFSFDDFDLNPSHKFDLSSSQVHINDMRHLVQTIASGKTPSLATSWWPSEATRRLVVICLSTLGLLFARLHIMGSQLPVFTRWVNIRPLTLSIS